MIFDWNDDKNEFLKKTRDISFEEIVILLEEGKIIDVIKHPNEKKYPNQKIYLVNRDGYIYAVPYIVDTMKNVIFLKTIYPSRLYTNKYLKED